MGIRAPQQATTARRLEFAGWRDNVRVGFGHSVLPGVGIDFQRPRHMLTAGIGENVQQARRLDPDHEAAFIPLDGCPCYHWLRRWWRAGCRGEGWRGTGCPWQRYDEQDDDDGGEDG